MQARLSAVQQALIVVTIVAVGVAALVHPAPNNADYRHALAELGSLGARFDQHKVEAALLESARAQARRPLAALAQQVSALSPVVVQASPPNASIDPLAELHITSLMDIERFSQPGASVAMAVAEPSGVASSLAWRIARDLAGSAQSGPIELRSAQLQAGEVAESAVALEAELFQLQNARQAVAAAAQGASTRLTDLERLYEARVKWRVSRQLRSDTYKALLEARKASKEAQRALRDADKRYESAVRSALAKSPAQDKAAASSPRSSIASGRAIMRIELVSAAGAKQYLLPVHVKPLQAELPKLDGVSLAQTRAAGLWDDVRDLTVPQATKLVQQRFNWHNRDLDLAGVRLGGAAVLQLTPCVLPLLLLLLLARMRAVSLDYNPFRTRVKSGLPRVGFPTRVLDALAIVVLPLVAAAFAVASLMYLGKLPALPLAAAVACLLLGAYAFIKLGELQRLMEDVVRSHSVPPESE